VLFAVPGPDKKVVVPINPARLGIPRLQPGEKCAVTRGRSRYYNRVPPAPAGGGSTDFWMKEITIITSYYCEPPDIIEAMKLIEWRNILVDDLITHRLPLTDFVKGFQLVTDGRKSIKVIIKPNEHKVAK
jgi:threonine dehydrogenase-like Zn-dependent dehydrogenase